MPTSPSLPRKNLQPARAAGPRTVGSRPAGGFGLGDRRTPRPGEAGPARRGRPCAADYVAHHAPRGRAHRDERGLRRAGPVWAVFLGRGPASGGGEGRWPCLRPQGAVAPRACSLSPRPAGHPLGGPAGSGNRQSLRPGGPRREAGESDCQPTWPGGAGRLGSCHPWREGLEDPGPLPSTLPFAIGGLGLPGVP